MDEPILAYQYCGLAPGGRCIYRDVDLKGIGHGMQRRSEDLVLEPQAREYEYGSVFSLECFCESDTLPRRIVTRG